MTEALLGALDRFWLPASLLGLVALWAALDPLRKHARTCPVPFCRNRSYLNTTPTTTQHKGKT